jgi:hypothetical protein
MAFVKDVIMTIWLILGRSIDAINEHFADIKTDFPYDTKQ